MIPSAQQLSLKVSLSGLSPVGRRREATAVSLLVLVGLAGLGCEVVWNVHLDVAGIRSAIETAIVFCAVLSAVLMVARFRHARLLGDLLLISALAAIGVADFAFHALPAYAGNEGGSTYAIGARLTLVVLEVVCFLALAFGDGRRQVPKRSRLPLVLVPAGACLVALGEGIDLVGHGLTSYSYATASVVCGAVGCCGMLVAACGFLSRQWERPRDAMLLGGTSLLLAGALAQRMITPLVASDWVTPADYIRLAAYALLLTIAVRLHRSTRDAQSLAAVQAERERIARDLHDGLAQDLAFIAAHSDRIAAEWGSDHPLTIAAQRALGISRRTMVDLEASHAPTLAVALREVSAELSAKFEIEVRFSVRNGVEPDVTWAERSNLVRIAREAVVNAVRHGGARHVDLVLGSRRSGVLLSVCDDGSGVDSPAARATRGTGFGIRTMRARAQALGTELVVDSGPAGGTRIMVTAEAPEVRVRAS